MPRNHALALAFALLAANSAAEAAGENPDLRIRADFRVPQTAPFAAGESVGQAEFRIQSRFMQVYYGGVLRADEFKFKVEFDYTDASDFASFAGSLYDVDYDVYINDGFVGRVDMNAAASGVGSLEYDSRHPDFPALPLPAAFPEPVHTFDVVRVVSAAAALPAIADPLPAGGVTLFQGELVEEFARGDANFDGKVDDEDFAIFTQNFDPSNLTGPHLGPVNGDFTGDNRSDLNDYQVLAFNWTGNGAVPAAPVSEPAQYGLLLAGLGVVAGAARRRRLSR